ncbi:hypothetical protein [Mycobacteroides abscessus]|uniref:hypothetical protein n=1 Tax=Mycobacteroides abscessus TaxID=36809 RepID=UPI00130015C9|nr:hypothetical protein [Mycobacteroides abscessus]
MQYGKSFESLEDAGNAAVEVSGSPESLQRFHADEIRRSRVRMAEIYGLGAVAVE